MASFTPDESDILTLELFAYNRLLVHHYEEAAQLYRLLRLWQPERINWNLGEAFCHVRLKDSEKALEALHAIGERACTKAQEILRDRLSIYANAQHPSSNPSKETIRTLS